MIQIKTPPIIHILFHNISTRYLGLLLTTSICCIVLSPFPTSAAHTIGTTACFFMNQRLYNFPAPGGSDPSINPNFLQELKTTCPQNGDVNVRLPMDQGSEHTFDTQILENIKAGFAVLQSDASLYQDESTKRIVDSYTGLLSPFFGPSFQADFAAAMVKMGRIGVLTGSKGRIRRVCSSFN